jgi:DNA-binding NarL/FixJ family response regulator
MIVDDESHVRLFISLIVGTLGPAVIHQAACGDDAITLFHSLCPKPGLVILDINMPGINGTETLRRLRSDGAECPIVMLTSLVTRQMVEDVITAGGTAFIRKDTPRAEIAALLMDVWKASIDQTGGASEPLSIPSAGRTTDRLDEVCGARREAIWDQDWFRGGI